MSSSYSNDCDDIAIQNRKFAKTCVEKKRRDRINKCLDELKDLMSITDDKAKFQKLEKAEILEMVVTHMRNIQVSGGAANGSSSMPPSNLGFYYAMAYRQCLNEFQSFLTVLPDINEEFKSRIMVYMTQRYMDIVAGWNKSSSSTSSQVVNNENEISPSQNEALVSNLVIKKEKKIHADRHMPYKQKNTHKKINNSNEQQHLSVLTNNEQNLSTHSSSSSSSSYFYSQTAKYGGSCSSLDSYQQVAQPNSPSNDSNTSSEVHNESSSMSANVTAVSGGSSPVMSNCSSPNNTNSNNSNCINNDTSLIAKQMLMIAAAAAQKEMYQNFYQNCMNKVWRPF